MHATVNFMVQTIGDYKAVIKYQNYGSVQEKLSQEDKPEERASSLAFSIYFCLTSSLLFMLESNRENVSLASPALRGNGSGNVCCLAAAESEKGDI